MQRLKALEETFAICQVSDYSQVNFESDFVFIGQTDEEKSLVCYSKDIPENAQKVDDGWKVFRIEGVLDFSLVGILSKISKYLANQGSGIFAVSTYNTDYVLTKSQDFEKALSVLKANGYDIEQ